MVICLWGSSPYVEAQLSLQILTALPDELTFEISGTFTQDTIADVSGSPGYLAIKRDWSNNYAINTNFFLNDQIVTVNNVLIGGQATSVFVQDGVSPWMDDIHFQNPQGTNTPIAQGTEVSGTITLTGTGFYDGAALNELELISGFNRDNNINEWARLEFSNIAIVPEASRAAFTIVLLTKVVVAWRRRASQ